MPPQKRLLRKIYFYRVNVGHASSGAPIPFNTVPIFDAINRLPFSIGNRYMECGAENILCCWILNSTPLPSVRFANIRRVDLPAIEHGGNLRPLSIPTDAGLAESIHAVFFPNNIVGSEFNFYGPRTSRLGEYFTLKAHGIYQNIQFEPLLRPNMAQQLNRLEGIRLFQLKIRRSYVDVMRQANLDLGNALDAAMRATDAQQVEIVLQPASRRGTLANTVVGRIVRSLIRRPDLREEARKCVLKGFDPQTAHVEEINLLNEQLVSKKSIITQNERTNNLNSDAVLEAISQAYSELQPEIEEAGSLML